MKISRTIFVCILATVVMIFIVMTEKRVTQLPVLPTKILLSAKQLARTAVSADVREKAKVTSETNFDGFESLRKKPLKSEKELETYAASLADSRLLLRASETLLSVEKGKLDERREAQRLNSISYLYEAARDARNPNREHVLDAIDAIVASRLPSGEEGVDPELAKSLQGDRIELFAVLLLESPERAQKRIEKTGDGQLQTIYRKALLRQLAASE